MTSMHSIIPYSHSDARAGSRRSFVRVHKGFAGLLPLTSPGQNDVLIQMLSEMGHVMSLSFALDCDAKELKRTGFVIADDNEILKSQYLRLQPYAAKFGLDVPKTMKKGFFQPIKRIVAIERLKKGKKIMISGLHQPPGVRRSIEETIEDMTSKIYKEETVSIQKRDLLRRLSIRAASHIRKRLSRLGTNDESEEKDKELLVKVKDLSLVHRRTPLFLARKNPFSRPSIETGTKDTMTLESSTSTSNTTYRDSTIKEIAVGKIDSSSGASESDSVSAIVPTW